MAAAPSPAPMTTTGRPKGVRKPLPGTPFGDRSSAPVQIAEGLLAGAPSATSATWTRTATST